MKSDTKKSKKDIASMVYIEIAPTKNQVGSLCPNHTIPRKIGRNEGKKLYFFSACVLYSDGVIPVRFLKKLEKCCKDLKQQECKIYGME